MKKYILSIMLFVSFYTSHLLAREIYKGNTIIAYVNFQEAFNKAELVQVKLKDIEKKETNLLTEKTQKESELQKKIQNFQNTESKLSETAKKTQQQSLQEEIMKFNQIFSEKGQKLSEEKEKMVAELENNFKKVVQNVAEKLNIDIVLNSAGMVYGSLNIKKNDITLDVVTEFNKLHPVKKEAPAKK